MPSREFSLRLQDMLTEISVIENTVAELTYETFSQDQQALRVVTILKALKLNAF